MKNNYFYILLSLLCAFCLSACNQKSGEPTDEANPIENQYNKYVATILNGDLDAFMDCWMEDGIRSEPGLPSIIGKENIRAHFEPIFNAGEYIFTQVGEPVIEICGDMAVSYRTNTITTIPADGSDKITTDIKVLSILKKDQEGDWKIYIDCVNFHPTWSMDSIPEEMVEDNPYY